MGLVGQLNIDLWLKLQTLCSYIITYPSHGHNDWKINHIFVLLYSVHFHLALKIIHVYSLMSQGYYMIIPQHDNEAVD